MKKELVVSVHRSEPLYSHICLLFLADGEESIFSPWLLTCLGSLFVHWFQWLWTGILFKAEAGHDTANSGGLWLNKNPFSSHLLEFLWWKISFLVRGGRGKVSVSEAMLSEFFISPPTLIPAFKWSYCCAPAFFSTGSFESSRPVWGAGTSHPLV